jgi:hypothetical protein
MCKEERLISLEILNFEGYGSHNLAGSAWTHVTPNSILTEGAEFTPKLLPLG